MFPIWYVLRCEEGNEKRAAVLLKQLYHCQSDIFLITFEKMKRYEGNWHCQKEILIRGYVFADVKNRKRLEAAAYDTSIFKASGMGEYTLCLNKEDKEFLENLSGKEHHISMSRGYIQEGITFITEGPLCGKERKIRKIDRHKRMARVDYPMKCFRKTQFWMGLEITAKS